MNNNEINNLDPEDIGLKQIMGSRFHDATKPMVEPITTKPTFEEAEAGIARSFEKAFGNEKNPQKPINKAMDAQWEPARPEPNWMDRLKDCVKWVGIFGFLSCLIFYWKQTGLMHESIAVPSMCVCTALAGWGAGRNIKRGM